MNIYRNPFIVGLWAPVYLLVATIAVTNDFLMAAIFIMATLGVLGAYVTDFPILPGLFMNEVAHKTALSSLLGMLFGLMLFLLATALTTTEPGADSSPMSPQGMFMATWGVMSLPAYPLMVFLISKVNKRDLEAEQAERDRKNKERKSKGGGPPIMDREGF
jgi:sugar phosphate permease